MNNSTNIINSKNTTNIASIIGGEIPIDFKNGFSMKIFGEGINGINSSFSIILKFPRSEEVIIYIKDDDYKYHTSAEKFFEVFIKENGNGFPDRGKFKNEDDYFEADTCHLNWCLNVNVIVAILERTAFSCDYGSDEDGDGYDEGCTPFSNKYYYLKNDSSNTISHLIGTICATMSEDAGKCKIFSTQKFVWEGEY